MISQVAPEEFGSAYQNGKARVQLKLAIPAETLANIAGNLVCPWRA